MSIVSSANLVVIKAILDACIWAPLANTGYLILTPLLEGESVESVGGLLQEQFVPVMKTEFATFFPYNLISFSLVPPLVRPFTTGFVSMCFAVYISWVTHLPAADATADAAVTAEDGAQGAASLELRDEVADATGAWPATAAVASEREQLKHATSEVLISISGRELRLLTGEGEAEGRKELDGQQLQPPPTLITADGWAGEISWRKC